MKSAAISRFVMMAAIAALVLVAGSTPLCAQISFTDFTSTTGLQLNGAAAPALNGNLHVLRVAPAAPFQSGSAFFTTPQPVAGSFSTTFTFQLNGSTTLPTPGDGFAFLIQNSSPTALDPDNGSDGCSIGFGDAPNPDSGCTSHTGGITNSLAIEFDTFENDDIGDMNNNHVLIQSCGTGANSVDSTTCLKAGNYNLPVIMADGNTHTVSISFTPSGSCTNTACPGTLDVILDSNDLFPATGQSANPVTFDIASIGLTNGTAFAGFTAATGGANDNQDILSWTFSPNSQSAVLATNVQSLLSFNGGIAQNSFDQTATLLGGVTSAPTLNVKAIPTDRNVCNKLVQQTFPLAQCFVFQNADGKGTHKPVLFELTCSNAQGDCGPSIIADLGNDFVFQNSDNPGFKFLSSTIGAYVGVLKGDSGSPGGACQIDSTHPLKFKFNQISGFTLSGDPLGGTTQKAKPGTSCWALVYGATGELPPGITITSPTATTYIQGSTVLASYTCKTPVTSKDPNGNSPVGPYLTVGSCTQSQAPNINNTQATCSVPTFLNGEVCTGGGVDTSTLGPHVFLVTAKDTAGNVNAKAVVYNVKNKPH